MSKKATQRRRLGAGAPRKTASELLFEKYVDQNGVCFDYEPSIPGKNRKPDYRVRWSGHELFVEVKELYARRERPAGTAWVDPYGHIRKAIEKAREKFKEFKDHCCVLVLHNIDDWEFRDCPSIVFGAMLGDVGTQMPFDPDRGELLMNEARSAFLTRGRMVEPNSRKPQNTTISAIAVLGDFTIPNPEYEREYKQRLAALAADLGREPPIEEIVGIRVDLHEHLRSTLGNSLQLTVFENPVARIPLARRFFDGNYDAKYRFNASLRKIERVFAGRGLRQAEQVTEADSDISSKIDRFIRAIVERFAPQRIVLFGSYAYGCPDPGSDVDLLVILPGDGNAADRSLEIRTRLVPDFPLDLLARSVGEVERRIELGDPFMREVLDKGKTLYPRKVVA